MKIIWPPTISARTGVTPRQRSPSGHVLGVESGSRASSVHAGNAAAQPRRVPKVSGQFISPGPAKHVRWPHSPVVWKPHFPANVLRLGELRSGSVASFPFENRRPKPLGLILANRPLLPL